MHLEALTRRRYAHELAVVGAGHGGPTHDQVAFGDELVDSHLHVRKPGLEHLEKCPGGGRPGRREPGLFLVLDEVLRYQLVDQIEVSTVDHLVVHAACQRLVVFGGHDCSLLCRAS